MIGVDLLQGVHGFDHLNAVSLIETKWRKSLIAACAGDLPARVCGRPQVGLFMFHISIRRLAHQNERAEASRSNAILKLHFFKLVFP